MPPSWVRGKFHDGFPSILPQITTVRPDQRQSAEIKLRRPSQSAVITHDHRHPAVSGPPYAVSWHADIYARHLLKVAILEVEWTGNTDDDPSAKLLVAEEDSGRMNAQSRGPGEAESWSRSWGIRAVLSIETNTLSVSYTTSQFL